MRKHLPRAVTRGQRQCGLLAPEAGQGEVFPAQGSGRAQFEDNTDLQIRGGSGQPETDDFYLPRQISPWFIQVLQQEIN